MTLAQVISSLQDKYMYITFPSGNLLIIPYRLIKFQVPWSRLFGYFGDTSSMQKFKGNYLKKVMEKQFIGTGAIKRQIPLLTLEKIIHFFLNRLSIMPRAKTIFQLSYSQMLFRKKRNKNKTLNQTNFPLKTSQGHLLFIHSAEQAS